MSDYLDNKLSRKIFTHILLNKNGWWGGDRTINHLIDNLISAL